MAQEIQETVFDTLDYLHELNIKNGHNELASIGILVSTATAFIVKMAGKEAAYKLLEVVEKDVDNIELDEA